MEERTIAFDVQYFALSTERELQKQLNRDVSETACPVNLVPHFSLSISNGHNRIFDTMGLNQGFSRFLSSSAPALRTPRFDALCDLPRIFLTPFVWARDTAPLKNRP